MTSTPSASALSAVLRCQGNILARKQANKKRPADSVYGLVVAYGANSDSRHGLLDNSYFRALWGFIFHRERVEIPGVLSITARFQTRVSRKSTTINSGCTDYLVKRPSTEKTGNCECCKMLNMKVSSANQCPKTKLKSDHYISAFNSKVYSLLSKNNNLVLRLEGRYFRQLCSEYPMTFCICIVCAQSKSIINQYEVDSIFSLGLLSMLKKRLIHLTAAVSDIVRAKLGIDWKRNQFHPDFDMPRRCVNCISDHHKEEESKMLEGEASEPGH